MVMMSVMMMVMVMMVVSMSALLVVDGAILFVAMLARSFELKGCMGNPVLGKLLADGVLDVVGVTVCNCVQGGIVVVAIHAPHVDVVDVLYTLDVAQMLANFMYVDTVRRFFEEEINGFFQILKRVNENKHRHTNRH